MNSDVTIVTGGSSGIGAAICSHLKREGRNVVNVDKLAPKDAPGGGYTFFQADLSQPAEARAAAVHIAEQYSIAALVNNAGVSIPGELEQITDEAFWYTMNLHLQAAIAFAQAVVPGMKHRRYGRIVNMSSRAALGKKARTVYGGSKAALIGMTRTWAMELGPHGITVNAVAPGPIVTDLF
jgi:3-oxoacyl-[acyl-carrier protein] reductase